MGTEDGLTTPQAEAPDKTYKLLILRIYTMPYGLLKQPLHITKAQELPLINALLHDEMADIDEIVFGTEQQVLDIPVRRQFHDGEEILIQDNGFSRVYEKYWLCTKVSIKHVLSWDCQNDQGIGCYSFNHWQYTKGLIRIEFNQMLVINIQVGGLAIEVADIGFNGRARIERQGGHESSSDRVY
ncbi:MAG: hypothetical protein PHU14_05920 [Methylovulum sp.]|nr:hypothetical protein [Methylovulum sp.]